jgi:hypothetical protein
MHGEEDNVLAFGLSEGSEPGGVVGSDGPGERNAWSLRPDGIREALPECEIIRKAPCGGEIVAGVFVFSTYGSKKAIW